ncbi:IS1595 family transposase [Clostridium culturomicium]|uniref:IS1595 family transposase n=1 Tax=Clostridium culturomicium TaxID=1499683 RepID=UPI00385731EF
MSRVSVRSIKADISDFNNSQLEQLFNYIGEMLTASSFRANLNKDFRESRFSKGEVCPHCQSTYVVKNGKLNEKQRYLCRDCKKSFNDLTKSALSCTKLPIDAWLTYAQGMILGLSIRKNAEKIGVCVKTSFYMRHKILDCIRAFMGTGYVDGVVEMDECFIPESYKGNHKKSGFVMPRPSRKRGKQVKKRGISNEQICIATAIDRNNNIILEPICKGRVTSDALESLYKEHVESESIICTDSHKSYIQFAKDLELDHKRIMRGYYKNGIYHINHVNSLHSNLKVWMYRFKGVATKFLSNYMAWFKWLQSFSDEKELIRTKNMIIHSVVPFVDTRICSYHGREAIFI